MFLTLPYQSIELSKFQFQSFTYDKKGRKVAYITYREGPLELNDLAILTPPLLLTKYDATANRLQFDTSKERLFESKWTAIQTKIVDMLFMNTHSIFSKAYTLEEIQSMLHSLFNNHCLTAYVFPTAAVRLADDTTCPITDIPAGTYLRCVIRLHGLMMVDYRGTPSIRIQHSVPFMSLVT